MNFSLTMADIMTFQNIDLPLWNTLYKCSARICNSCPHWS